MTRWIRQLLALGMLGAALPACALDLHGFKPDEIALWAAPVEGRGVLTSHRADVPVNPASTMKLLTSWAALNRLGPTYRWKTDLVSAAPLENGVLKGDVYWLGRGDPRFSNANLQQLLRELRRRGIQQIDGRLVLDRQAFSRIASAEKFGGDDGKTFMVDPDTQLTQLKVAWLHFYHDDNGPRVALDPALPGVTLSANLQPGGQGACGDVRQHVHIHEADNQIRVSGTLPRRCDGQQAFVNVLDHVGYAGQAFTALWHELGGQGPREVTVGPAPANARLLASFESEPLPVELAEMNKYSNNTMARALYLTLGREDGHSPDTVANAEYAVRRTLAENHISDEPLVLENGAGLSRRERVSAHMLGEVLLNSARGPYAGEFIASLPIASTDGTLKKRFKDVGPRLRLKTGTLSNVKALAGYWQAPDGRRLALVAIVNSPRALAMGKALDQVVDDVIERFASAAP